jgi:hypothetical protein
MSKAHAVVRLDDSVLNWIADTAVHSALVKFQEKLDELKAAGKLVELVWAGGPTRAVIVITSPLHEKWEYCYVPPEVMTWADSPDNTKWSVAMFQRLARGKLQITEQPSRITIKQDPAAALFLAAERDVVLWAGSWREGSVVVSCSGLTDMGDEVCSQLVAIEFQRLCGQVVAALLTAGYGLVHEAILPESDATSLDDVLRKVLMPT